MPLVLQRLRGASTSGTGPASTARRSSPRSCSRAGRPYRPTTRTPHCFSDLRFVVTIADSVILQEVESKYRQVTPPIQKPGGAIVRRKRFVLTTASRKSRSRSVISVGAVRPEDDRAGGCQAAGWSATPATTRPAHPVIFSLGVSEMIVDDLYLLCSRGWPRPSRSHGLGAGHAVPRSSPSRARCAVSGSY